MKLSLKAMAIAGGILWGGSVLCVGLIYLANGTYGLALLQMCSSIYPGYHVTQTIGSVLVGAGYALLDGAVGGLIFGWLYNIFAG